MHSDGTSVPSVPSFSCCWCQCCYCRWSWSCQCCCCCSSFWLMIEPIWVLPLLSAERFHIWLWFLLFWKIMNSSRINLLACWEKQQQEGRAENDGCTSTPGTLTTYNKYLYVVHVSMPRKTTHSFQKFWREELKTSHVKRSICRN